MALFNSLEGKHCVSTFKIAFLRGWQETGQDCFRRFFQSKLWADKRNVSPLSECCKNMEFKFGVNFTFSAMDKKVC